MSDTPVLIQQNPREIIREVGEWAQRQPWHPTHAPDYGVVEEVGELTHAVLKHLQNIRGFGDVNFFREKAKDAIGDAMVYLSHWCYLKNCYYIVKDQSYNPNLEYRDRLGQLTIHMSQMLTVKADIPAPFITIATNIATVLSHICLDFGWDLLDDCVIPTWHKVKRREWDKIGSGVIIDPDAPVQIPSLGEAEVPEIITSDK